VTGRNFSQDEGPSGEVYVFRVETVIAAIGLIAVFGLVYGFMQLTDGINQPITTSSVNRSVTEDAVAPPADTLADDGSPVQLGGPSIMTNADQSQLMINFNQCNPGSGAIDFESGSGSVTFTIAGLQGNDCQASYKLPNEDATCTVPVTVGQLRFDVSSDGVNFGVIDRYCGN
jgi:hypothetical protein